MTSSAQISQTRDEYADLIESLATQRYFLTVTARGLTDEQAAATPTASALSIGGLIKHVTVTSRSWLAFAQHGSEAMRGGDDMTADDYAGREREFQLQPGETIAAVLADFQQLGTEYDEFLAGAPDLGLAFPLPAAPWFEPGAVRSVRRVMTHVIAETAQHAGHADIIRETIDGQKTMG